MNQPRKKLLLFRVGQTLCYKRSGTVVTVKSVSRDGVVVSKPHPYMSGNDDYSFSKRHARELFKSPI